MSYKYTITQENNDNKARLTYEFSAQDETEMVEELNTFMVSIGFAQSGFLQLVDDEDMIDDYDSESESIYSDFPWASEVNPEMESYKNFEYPHGEGQTEYGYSDQTNIYVDQQLYPYPMDRPSQATYRVDSYDTANVQYYGA